MTNVSDLSFMFNLSGGDSYKFSKKPGKRKFCTIVFALALFDIIMGMHPYPSLYNYFLLLIYLNLFPYVDVQPLSIDM